MTLRALTLVLAWLLALFVLSHYALAATLQVAPVTLELQKDQRAAALYLTNTGQTPIHAQIRVYDWSQSGGKDVLTLTNNVVSSPAMTALAPGQQQLIRVIVLQPDARLQEQSYRLIIDELPGQTDATQNHNGVHFLLRYSIPVFIASDQQKAIGDETLYCSRQDPRAAVWCHNSGTSHIRLSNLQALANNGQVIETLKGLAGYVLPGQMFALPLKHSENRAIEALRVTLNENTHASQLPLHPTAPRPASLDASDVPNTR